MTKKLSLVLALLASFMFYSPHLDAAATLDQAMCSTADKSGGNPSLCDGQEMVDSANQELVKLYGGTILPVTVGGTADVITGTTTPVDTALGDGDMRRIKPNANNTGTVTYNDNGLGAKQVVSAAGAALAADDLQSSSYYILTFNSANDEWRVLTPLGSGVAPANSPVITTSNTTALTAERVLTAGNCTTVTDGGANTTATVAVASCSSANLATAVTDETGSGSAVFSSSPSLTTPTIGGGGANFSGSTSGTTNLKATATAGSTTLTLPAATDTLVGKATTDTLINKSIDLTSNTLTATSAQVATAVTNETGTGLLVFNSSPSLTTPAIGSGGMTFAGSVSGTTTVAASGTASGTLTLPAATDTLVGKATPDTLTNKAINLTSNTLTATSAQMGTAITDETGSGSAVFATSPTLVTPNIGVATATSVNKVAITAPATSATLTLTDGTTVTGPAASGTIMTLGNAETVTGAKTFGAAGNVGKLIVAGSTSGTTIVNASATASGTLTLPAATDTLVAQATTQTLTNKTIDLTSNILTATSAQVATAVTNETGTGVLVFNSSPSLTTPAIGSGGMTFAGSSSGTTTVAASATASGTLTLPAATDTLVGKATIDTLTNKSISLGSNTLTTTSAQLATAASDETGSGALVFATSPSLTTPTIGSAGMSFTGSSSGTTVVVATAAASGTLTLPAATDTLVGKATPDTLTNKTINLTSNTLTATSAQLITAISDETGTGSAVFATSPTFVTPNLGTPSAATLTNATGLPVSTGIAGLGVGVATALATPSSANIASAVADETGSGALVFATSPALVTPDLGTPSAATLTNATGLPVSTGISGLGTGVATALATPSSANVAAAVTGETGSGALVFATSPALVTPDLGTPSAATLTNATGLPVSTGIAGLGTGVATALATPSSANLRSAITDEEGTGGLMFGITAGMADDITCTGSHFLRRNAGDTAWECAAITGGGDALTSNPLSQFAATTSAQLAGVISDETGSGAAVFANSPAFVTPDLGTPSAATLTNATGLPISTGVSGLGTGVATWLATPSSANLASAVTGEVGTGALMFGLASTMSDDLSCTGSQVVRRNSGDTAFECATVSGTGDMVAANNLSDVASALTAFSNIKQAATTSATGVVELATTAEAEAGTDTTRAITANGLLAAFSGKKTIWVPAGAMLAETTTGCASGTTETTTNKVMYKTLDCDASTKEGAQFAVAMPKSWDESTITFRADWTAASGSGDVIWAFSCLATSNDDTLDAAFGTEVTVTDTLLTAGDDHQSAESGAVTASGTPAENDHLWCRVQRDAAAGGDTLAVDAKLLGVRVLYTTNAMTDD